MCGYTDTPVHNARPAYCGLVHGSTGRPQPHKTGASMETRNCPTIRRQALATSAHLCIGCRTAAQSIIEFRAYYEGVEFPFTLLRDKNLPRAALLVAQQDAARQLHCKPALHTIHGQITNITPARQTTRHDITAAVTHRHPHVWTNGHGSCCPDTLRHEVPKCAGLHGPAELDASVPCSCGPPSLQRFSISRITSGPRVSTLSATLSASAQCQRG